LRKGFLRRMLAKIYSAVLYGVDARQIEVEIDLSQGLPLLSIVGLPDLAVKESRDRVRSAIKNTGFHFPVKRVTVNLPFSRIYRGLKRLAGAGSEVSCFF
jgi:hypothetical protein